MALITKMLEIAVNDADAGRISIDQLLLIFQESIENGDILEKDNEFCFVTCIVPLIDEGVLRSSEHSDALETRLNAAATEHSKRLRNQKRWWEFWK